ncbi:hypothetical protein Nmel_017983 [Mimus melanotis]
MSKGQVEAAAWQGEARLATLRLPQVKVNDGAWHHVELELREGPGRSPSATLLLLTLDYGRHQAVGNVSAELQGLRLHTLSLGGLLGDSGTVEEGFQGCLQVQRHGHRWHGEHAVAGVGVRHGFGDVEEGVKTWSQGEGSTGAWHRSWENGHRDVGTDAEAVAQGEDRAQ